MFRHGYQNYLYKKLFETDREGVPQPETYIAKLAEGSWLTAKERYFNILLAETLFFDSQLTFKTQKTCLEVFLETQFIQKGASILYKVVSDACHNIFTDTQAYENTQQPGRFEGLALEEIKGNEQCYVALKFLQAIERRAIPHGEQDLILIKVVQLLQQISGVPSAVLTGAQGENPFPSFEITQPETNDLPPVAVLQRNEQMVEPPIYIRKAPSASQEADAPAALEENTQSQPLPLEGYRGLIASETRQSILGKLSLQFIFEDREENTHPIITTFAHQVWQIYQEANFPALQLDTCNAFESLGFSPLTPSPQMSRTPEFQALSNVVMSLHETFAQDPEFKQLYTQIETLRKEKADLYQQLLEAQTQESTFTESLRQVSAQYKDGNVVIAGDREGKCFSDILGHLQALLRGAENYIGKLDTRNHRKNVEATFCSQSYLKSLVSAQPQQFKPIAMILTKNFKEGLSTLIDGLTTTFLRDEAFKGLKSGDQCKIALRAAIVVWFHLIAQEMHHYVKSVEIDSAADKSAFFSMSVEDLPQLLELSQSFLSTFNTLFKNSDGKQNFNAEQPLRIGSWQASANLGDLYKYGLKAPVQELLTVRTQLLESLLQLATKKFAQLVHEKAEMRRGLSDLEQSFSTRTSAVFSPELEGSTLSNESAAREAILSPRSMGSSLAFASPRRESDEAAERTVAND